jgi:hypothetical protein
MIRGSAIVVMLRYTRRAAAALSRYGLAVRLQNKIAFQASEDLMAMGFFARTGAVLRIIRRKKGPMEAMRLMQTRRALMLGMSVMELAQAASGRVPITVKVLASVKTSALIGCPF